MQTLPPVQSALVRQPLGATHVPLTHQLVGAEHCESFVQELDGWHVPEMHALPAGQSPSTVQVERGTQACVDVLHVLLSGQSASARQPVVQVPRDVSQNSPEGQSSSKVHASAITQAPVCVSHRVPDEQSPSMLHGQPTPTQM